MGEYISVCTVFAREMNIIEYAKYRNKIPPKCATNFDIGYCVEYVKNGKTIHIAWYSKDKFEKLYERAR